MSRERGPFSGSHHVILLSRKTYPDGHVIRRESRGCVRCDGASGTCDRPVERCEYVRHAGGIAFYHYCDRCWITVDGTGSSPRDRASIGGKLRADSKVEYLRSVGGVDGRRMRS